MPQARSDRPRIAIVSRLYPSPYAPHRAPFNRTQFRLLAERYDVSVLVPVPWHEWLRHRRELTPVHREGLDLRYACFVFPPKVGRAAYPAWFTASLLPELRWLKQVGASCLLASWAFPDAVGTVALGRRLGIPVVIRTYGSDVNVHAAGALNRAQLRWASERAFAITCVSEALKRQLVQIGVAAEKISVIPTGVDRAAFAPMQRAEARAQLGLALDRRAILFVGNLLRAKGVRELLAAFARLARTRSALDLIIVGDGPERASLAKQVERLNLQDRVLFTGRIGHAEVTTWINAADLLCLPSHREGLPNVVLEAMACGVPVVATNVGGIPEAVTNETGILVPPEDDAALEAALACALDGTWNPERIMAQAARFSWEASTEALSSLLDRAIRG